MEEQVKQLFITWEDKERILKAYQLVQLGIDIGIPQDMFNQNLTLITSIKDPNEAIELLEKLPKESFLTEKSSDQNIPTNLEGMLEDLENRNQTIAAAYERANTQGLLRDQLIRRSAEKLRNQKEETKQTVYESQEEKERKLFTQAAPTSQKNIYIETKQPLQPQTITPEVLANLSNLAANYAEDPEKTIKDLAEVITTSPPAYLRQTYTTPQLESLSPLVAQQILESTTKTLKDVADSKVDLKNGVIITPRPSSLTYLNYLLVTKSSPQSDITGLKDLTSSTAITDDISRSVMQEIAGPQATQAILGANLPPEQIHEVDRKQNQTTEVDMGQLLDFAKGLKGEVLSKSELLYTKTTRAEELLRFMSGFKVESDTGLSSIFRGINGLFTKSTFSPAAAGIITAGTISTTSLLFKGTVYESYVPQILASWKTGIPVGADVSLLKPSFVDLRLGGYQLSNFDQTALAVLPIKRNLETVAATSIQAGKIPGYLPSGALTLGSPTGVIPTSVIPVSATGTIPESVAASTAAAKAAQIATQLLTKVGVSATTAASVGGAVGSIVSFLGTPLGGFIVFIGTTLLTLVVQNWPKIKKWLEENGLTLATFSTIVGSILFAVGNPVFGGLFIVAGIGGAAAGSGGVGAGISSITTNIGRGGVILSKNYLKEIWKPLAGITIGSLVLTAFIVFIINSGAYIVPSDGSGTLQKGEICEANPGCPCGWPILPKEGEASFLVLQGPRASHSHSKVEAIDIAATVGHPVSARHEGTVSLFENEAYGKAVRVSSTCNGKNFISVYSHFNVITVQTGQKVSLGDNIGISGDTGMGGPHLHYEFSPNDTLPMSVPYIPKTVPRFCDGFSQCRVVIP